MKLCDQTKPNQIKQNITKQNTHSWQKRKDIKLRLILSKTGHIKILMTQYAHGFSGPSTNAAAAFYVQKFSGNLI